MFIINSEIKAVASKQLQDEIELELKKEDKSMASILEENGRRDTKYNPKSIEKDVD
jgi:hypothetical protein